MSWILWSSSLTVLQMEAAVILIVTWWGTCSLSTGNGSQIILNFNKYFHGFTELGITLCVTQYEMKISFFLFENFTIVLVISKTSSSRMHVDRPPKASSL